MSYRLEVLESTVHSKDMRDFKVDAVRYGRAFYDEYTRIYADIIGRNLTVRLNGQPVPLQLRSRSQTTDDAETGKPLGHLRCDFEFTADLPLRPGADNRLEVTEGNFSELDGHHGKIQFAFANQANVSIKRQEVPDPAQEQPLGLGATHRVSVDFVPTGGNEPTFRAAAPAEPKIEHEPDHADEARHDHDVFLRTFRQLRESEVGLVLMLLIFAGLGAAHALTPGHGKTLVAAYLVGEHGTIWHALLLGLVTTITHTGAVLIIALILFLLPEAASANVRQAIQTGLGLVLGISVACLGIWLLLQRLSGRADHIHLGGGHDHHHHHTHTHTTPTGNSPRGLGGIILLGINGGLIPCWDAVAILVAVVGTNEFWMALPALLAFSAGLAGVLVAIGILVVQFRNFAGSKWGEGKVVRVLPLLSAVIVTSMGIYLCYSSMPQTGR